MTPHTLKQFVWHFLKDHKLALWGFPIVAILWSVEMSLSPYLMKVLIDTVNAFEGSAEGLIRAIMGPAILYASMSLMMNLNFRFYEYVCLTVFPQIKKDVNNTMFNYLSGSKFYRWAPQICQKHHFCLVTIYFDCLLVEPDIFRASLRLNRFDSNL